MHPYLPHLLSDIAAATRPDIPFLPPPPKSFDEEMEEIENWIAEDPPHTFGYWCGLDSANFPPAAQLTSEEMLSICNAFEKMMFSYNCGIELPDALPIALRYNYTVETLNEKTIIPDFGTMHFDYCSGYAPDCKFKEYCPCLEYWNSEDENINKTTDEV